MDKALLEERKKFKQSFMAVHSSSSKPTSKKQNDSEKPEKKKSEKEKKPPSAQEKLNLAQLKAMGGGSQFKFGVLTKIVKHMKARHLDGEDTPLTLSEVLDETNQLDIDSKTKYWLENEALRNNPKISASIGTGRDGSTTYMFKPPFHILTKKALLKLLKQYSIKGKGGILLDDLQESLPNCEKVIRLLEEKDEIWLVQRPADKKKVVYYHDNSDDFEVEDEFVRLWRQVTVDGKDDLNIEEYLEKEGIKSMQNEGMRKVAQKRKIIRKTGNKRKRALKDNTHIAEVLEDYSEMTTQAYSKK